METVDTSRPFTSVKEAVALFGDRILSPPMPKQDPPWKSTPIDPNKTPKNGNPNSYDHHQHPSFMDTLKKIEAELQGMKTELKKLKERESETEVALATLNAELHKNMSRMAQAEANVAAAKAASFREGEGEGERNRRRELILRMENSSLPTLGQVLNFGEKGGVFGERKIERERKKKKKMKMKKKPIIPLVGDLFSWKKSSSANIHLQNDNNLYTSSYMYI